MRVLAVVVSAITMGAVAVACASLGASDKSDAVPGEYLLGISKTWKADSNGCKGLRRELDVAELIDSLRLFVRWRADVIKLLGPPNQTRHATYPDYVASPDQEYTTFDYYIDPRCREGRAIGADTSACSLYFVTKPGQDSILRISMRCVD